MTDEDSDGDELKAEGGATDAPPPHSSRCDDNDSSGDEGEGEDQDLGEGKGEEGEGGDNSSNNNDNNNNNNNSANNNISDRVTSILLPRRLTLPPAVTSR